LSFQFRCPVTTETVDCSKPADLQQRNSCRQRCGVLADYMLNFR